MNERKEFLLLRAGTIMGVGVGLCIGLGLMLVDEAIVPPHWLAEVHSHFAVIGIPPLICFLGGVLLAKKARAAE